MQGGVQIELDRLLPVPRLARLAVDYANLRTLNAESMRGLIRPDPRAHLRPELVDPVVISQQRGRHALPDPLYVALYIPRTKLVYRESFHAWIRQLMEAAASRCALSEDNDAALHDLCVDHRPKLNLVFRRDRTGWNARVEFQYKEVAWYIGIGCAAITDSRGPYRGLVKRCENFGGSGHGSKACGGYVLMQSEGGRKPSRFCSRACQNRVNQRNKDRKRRELETAERPRP
jgi:hypothetical protein